jgi:hypothetical protein
VLLLTSTTKRKAAPRGAAISFGLTMLDSDSALCSNYFTPAASIATSALSSSSFTVLMFCLAS